MIFRTDMPKKKSQRRSLSRKEKRDLDIEISFLEGLVRKDPRDAAALRILGDDYTRRGRFPDGLKIDEQLTKLQPTDPLAHYNLACSYSLTQRLDLAALALEKAIALGYRDFDWLAKDPDLHNLRLDPSYNRIQSRVKTLQCKSV